MILLPRHHLRVIVGIVAGAGVAAAELWLSGTAPAVHDGVVIASIVLSVRGPFGGY